MVKNLPVVQGTWVPSPGWEDPLEKGVFLEKRYPLQYPCLENPMDRGARWGTIHGVVQRVRHDWATLWLSVLIYIFLKCKQFYKIWSHVWVCASNATIRTQTFQHAKGAHFASTLPSHFPWNIVLSNSGLIPHHNFVLLRVLCKWNHAVCKHTHLLKTNNNS